MPGLGVVSSHQRVLPLCAEESCHVIQQNYFFWKKFPVYSAHDGEPLTSALLVFVCKYSVAQSSVVFQSLKSGKDLKKTQIMGNPSGYASLFD